MPTSTLLAPLDTLDDDLVPDEPISPPTLWEEAVTCIMAESGCNRDLASRLACMVQRAKRHGHYHLRVIDLEKLHPLLEVVMPDNTTTDPGCGSAHDALNRLCFPHGDHVLRHIQTESELAPCAVMVMAVEIQPTV